MIPYFEFGRILKPQGVKGEMKAELYTHDPARIAELDHVYLGEPGDLVRHELVKARTDGRFAYLTISDVNDRNEAEKLRDKLIYIEREQAAPLPEGAFYISDLLGLRVQTNAGDVLGTLDDVMQTGAKDIYVVRREDGETFMFPAVEDVFVERSPEKGVIVLDKVRLSQVAEYDV